MRDFRVASDSFERAIGDTGGPDQSPHKKKRSGYAGWGGFAAWGRACMIDQTRSFA